MTTNTPRLNIIPDEPIADDALIADIAGGLRAACVEFGILDTLPADTRQYPRTKSITRYHHMEGSR